MDYMLIGVSAFLFALGFWCLHNAGWLSFLGG